MTTEYQKYEKEIEGKFSDDLKNELARANRVKLSSITALNMPQLIVSGVDEKPVITRGSLLTGYTEKDMALHTLENRSLQSIKVSGVLLICIGNVIQKLGAHYKPQGNAGTDKKIVFYNK